MAEEAEDGEALSSEDESSDDDGEERIVMSAAAQAPATASASASSSASSKRRGASASASADADASQPEQKKSKGAGSETDEKKKKKKKKKDDDVSVEFEFCDPKEDDFLMVKSLLSQGGTRLVPGMEELLSALTQDICEQGAVGTTVCVEKDVYSFATALSAKHYGDTPYMRAMLKAVRAACPKGKAAALDKAMGQGVAWLVSERLVNMPHQLVPSMHQALVDDVEWARSNVEATGGSKDMFDFQHVLFVAPCYVGKAKDDINNESESDDDDDEEEDEEDDDDDDDDDDDNEASKKAAKGKGTAKAKGKGKANANAKGKRAVAKQGAVATEPLFVHFEHDIMVEAASLTFPCKLVPRKVLEGKASGAVPQRHRPQDAVVGLVSVEKLKAIIPEFSALISED